MSTVKLKNYLPLPYGPPMIVAIKAKFTPIVREDKNGTSSILAGLYPEPSYKEQN
jgi:hypothetical protein